MVEILDPEHHLHLVANLNATVNIGELHQQTPAAVEGAPRARAMEKVPVAEKSGLGAKLASGKFVETMRSPEWREKARALKERLAIWEGKL